MIAIILGLLITALGLLLAGSHGYIAAIVLGLSTGGVDYLWQWARYQLSKKQRPNNLMGLILVGFAVRVGSLFLLLKLAVWWLGYTTPEFYSFIGCLILAVVVLSQFGAYQMKRETG